RCLLSSQELEPAYPFRESSEWGSPLVRRYFSHGLIPDWAVDEASEVFTDAFDRLEGKTIGGKLDSHYLEYRNRFHFGLSGTQKSGIIIWHPLASPSLLRAARGLPAEVKSTGRVVFDVTRELCEIAAYLPYDTPARDWSTVPYHQPGRYDGVSFSLQPAPELLTKAHSRNASGSAPRRPSVREDVDRGKLISTEIIRHFSYLRNSNSAVSDLMTDKIMGKIKWLEAKKSRFHRVWYSRITGLVDILGLSD
ncbi:hypothetical protein, partial [Falsiroseomonas tokyonensis]